MLDAGGAQLRASASRVVGGCHAKSPGILAGTSSRNVARGRLVSQLLKSVARGLASPKAVSGRNNRRSPASRPEPTVLENSGRLCRSPVRSSSPLEIQPSRHHRPVVSVAVLAGIAARWRTPRQQHSRDDQTFQHDESAVRVGRCARGSGTVCSSFRLWFLFSRLLECVDRQVRLGGRDPQKSPPHWLGKQHAPDQSQGGGERKQPGGTGAATGRARRLCLGWHVTRALPAARPWDRGACRKCSAPVQSP